MAIFSNYTWDFDAATKLGQPHCRAFVDATAFGCLRIRGIRVYERADGRLDLCFPFLHRMVRCPHCGDTTPYDAPCCQACGTRRFTRGAIKLDHRNMQPSIVHPISEDARAAMTREIVAEYLEARGMRDAS